MYLNYSHYRSSLILANELTDTKKWAAIYEFVCKPASDIVLELSENVHSLLFIAIWIYSNATLIVVSSISSDNLFDDAMKTTNQRNDTNYCHIGIAHQIEQCNLPVNM